MTPDNNPSTVALMLDIETLATTPDAQVVQVGWCVGNWDTKEILVGPTNAWISSLGYGHIDIDTVRWWMKQSDAARNAVFHPPENARVCAPWKLHQELAYLVKGFDCTVWGSPAMFDLPILTHMFKSDGLGKPWKYNVERDMMTLYKLIDPQGKLKPADNALAHDAASDAEWQLQYLFKLMDALRGHLQGVPA